MERFARKFLCVDDGHYINSDLIGSVFIEGQTAHIYLKAHDYEYKDGCDYEMDAGEWLEFARGVQ